jgi:hypothetical protein
MPIRVFCGGKCLEDAGDPLLSPHVHAARADTEVPASGFEGAGQGDLLLTGSVKASSILK